LKSTNKITKVLLYVKFILKVKKLSKF